MSDTAVYSERIAKVRKAFQAEGVHALLLTNLEEGAGNKANIRYLTGFTGSYSVCILTSDKAILFTDPRYGGRAELEVVLPCEVRVLFPFAWKDKIKELGIERLGIIDSQMTVDIFYELRRRLRPTKIVRTSDVVSQRRVVKDKIEVEAIQKAVKLMEEVLEGLYCHIKPGVTTDCELATDLKAALIQRGYALAFDPIILSGVDSALPHGEPFGLREERRRGVFSGEKIIQLDDIVQFDVGCVVEGYVSDISRVAISGCASEAQRKMHKALTEAINETIKLYRPGIPTRKAALRANEVLQSYGFDLVPHALGHGIGLEEHEDPWISASEKCKDIFQVGNVVTIEPGIYIPGYGGMRIERDVLITPDGPEFLDGLSADLVEIKKV